MIFFQNLVEQRARTFFEIWRPALADTKKNLKIITFLLIILYANQLQQKLKHQKSQNVMIFYMHVWNLEKIHVSTFAC
jgi:hypothetical protein